MSSKIKRPKADKKKINSKEQFELCYIRHQYIRKVDYNPSEDEMRPYHWILDHTSRNTFYMYQMLFQMVGLYLEDIINTARVHLVSFLGLFALERMPEKMKAFKALILQEHGRRTTKIDILQKNKANFTLFLKQRMEDLVRICRQKARNIKGLPTEEYAVFTGTKRPPKVIKDLLDNYEALGYKKIDVSIFKSIRKKLDKKQEGPVYFINNSWYICVPLDKKTLELVDFSGAGLDPYDSMHNMTPERVLFHVEEEELWKDRKEKFSGCSREDKALIVRSFVEKNKNNPKFRDEIRTARKMLKRLEG